MSKAKRIDADALNFLRRAYRMVENSERTDALDSGGALHEVTQNITEQLGGMEVACAKHVFGSVALARVLHVATETQRISLAEPLIRADLAELMTDRCARRKKPDGVACPYTWFVREGGRRGWVNRLTRMHGSRGCSR